uniref:Uncharacterized protein n=1 Tax=Oryza glumipatula TaxID=40148 RepID=A0A0E0BGV7_9ORYZ
MSPPRPLGVALAAARRAFCLPLAGRVAPRRRADRPGTRPCPPPPSTSPWRSPPRARGAPRGGSRRWRRGQRSVPLREARPQEPVQLRWPAAGVCERLLGRHIEESFAGVHGPRRPYVRLCGGEGRFQEQGISDRMPSFS